MYFVNTRIDICFTVNQLSYFMVDPTKLEWKLEKHVVKYLRGTIYFALWYKRISGVKLQWFINEYWAGIPSYRNNTLIDIFSFWSAIVSWYSRKYIFSTLILLEVEYMDANQVAWEVIWMRNMVFSLFIWDMEPTLIHCDNQSSIKLFENPMFHDSFKHIDIMYHHQWGCLKWRIIMLQYIPTEEKDAHILIKDLLRGMFEFYRSRIVRKFYITEKWNTQYMKKTQAHKTRKTRETHIYLVHLVLAMSTTNNQSFLSIIRQNEETQPKVDPL